MSVVQHNKMADKDVVTDHERETLRGFLNKRLRVKLSDGRFVVGDLLCTNRDMNTVLGNCEESIPRTKEGHDTGEITTGVRRHLLE